MEDFSWVSKGKSTSPPVPSPDPDVEDFSWVMGGGEPTPKVVETPQIQPPPLAAPLAVPKKEPNFIDTLLGSLTPGLDQTLQQINRQNRPLPVKPSLPEPLPNLQEQNLNRQLAERQAGLGPDTTIEPSDPFGDLDAEDKIIKEIIPAYQVGSLGADISKKKYQITMSDWAKANPIKYLLGLFFSGPTKSGGLMGSGILSKDKEKELVHEIEQMNIRLRRKGQLMTTDDIGSFGDFVDYFQTMTASSAKQMGKAILSGGTMTPLLMIEEMNANLEGIEGLDINDRMALASTGGLIAAALENLGLGLLIRGLPKEVLGKIGAKKLGTFLEKTLAGRVAGKVTGRAGIASLTEGMTEGSQEGVAVVAEILGGRDFKPGEIASRLFEATAAGGTVGLGFGGVTGVGSSLRRRGEVTEEVTEEPERKQPDVPKFDTTIDRRKKLTLPEDVEAKPVEEGVILPEGKFKPEDFKDDVDLGADATQELTEAESAQLIEPEEKEKPFRIQPKVFPEPKQPKFTEPEKVPAEPTPEAVSTPQAEEVVSPTVEPGSKAVSPEKLTQVFEEFKQKLQSTLPETTIEPTVEPVVEAAAEPEVAAEEEVTPAEVEVKEEVEAKPEPKVETTDEEIERRMKAVQEQEKEDVDIYDVNVKVPAKSLFNRDKDRAEFMAEEYPDGMNWDEYRAELGEIKQEQLDDIDSDKDVDMDFGDELDRRADNNFTKAFNKMQRQKAPKPEPKVEPVVEPVVEAEEEVEAVVEKEPEKKKPGPKVITSAEELSQKILAKRQQEEFDKLADGIALEEDRIKLTEEEKAEGLREDELDIAASKGKPTVKSLGQDGVQKEAETTFGKKTVRRLLKNNALKIVKTAKDLPSNLKVKLMTAYHGTPHAVDKFSTDKIGTGEGAQAYGWGLYFATKKKIAEWYHEGLSRRKGLKSLERNDLDDYYKEGNIITFAANMQSEGHGLGSQLDPFVNLRIVSEPRWSSGPWHPLHFEVEVEKEIDKGGEKFILTNLPQNYWNSLSKRKLIFSADPNQQTFRIVTGRESTTQPEGGVYQVDLAPKEDEYLDLDKTLSEQSQAVKDGLLDVLEARSVSSWLTLETRESLKSQLKGLESDSPQLKSLTGKKQITGKEFYKILSLTFLDRTNPDKVLANKEASQLLLSKGVRGNKYLEGSSRKKGKGGHNYVIFDESDVTIEAKFSKSPAAIKGAYDPETGVTYLVSDNIEEGETAGVFLHEVGEHASLEQMVGKKNYDQIAGQIDDLVKSGDEVATAANARIPEDTPEKFLQSEKIAYLVQEVQDRTAKGETVSSKVKTLYNRVMNLIRKFIQSLPAYRKMAGRAALKKLESGELLTPENMASLARQAVDYHSEGKVRKPTKEGKSRQFTDLVQQYVNKEITHEELIKKQNERSPIKPFDSVPELKTPKEVEELIRSQHAQAGVDRGIYGENKEHTKKDDPVATRIDIRTFINKGEYVVTIHSDKKTGKVIGYTSSIWLESPEGGKVEFWTDPEKALRIALDESTKSTFARIWANSKGKTPAEAHAQAEAIMDGTAPDADQWQQVHMNPERASYFYDMDGNPVVEADEVIQVGGLVYAKGVVNSTVDDPRFTAHLKEKKETPKRKATPDRGELQFAEGAEPETTPTTETPIGESKFADVTEAIKAAHGKTRKDKVGTLKSIWNVTKEAATTIKDQMTRAHKLLDPKKFGLTTDYLRLMQETGSYAKHKAYTDVYSVVGEMNDTEQLVFSMNLILPDMIKDIDSGLLDPNEGLPFGYKSIEDVKADLENFQAQAKQVSEDTKTPTDINASIEKRTAFMKELREELVDEGLLREELLEDDRYFHHQVLEYLNMEDAGFTVSLEKPGKRETKQGWQKARTGSTKDYNTKYLDAEFEVLSQARQQLETKRLLNKIKIANDKGTDLRKLRTEINEQRKIKGKKPQSLEQVLKEAKGFEGYVIWKPNPNSVWYHTYTVADKVALEVLAEVEATNRRIAENKKALEEGKPLPEREGELDKPWTQRKRGVEITPADMGEAMIKGEDEKWIIPKELADTLNTPTKNVNEAFPVAWSRKGIRAWKIWTLLNPFRIFRYNLNNMSGDLDIAVAYAPGILKGMKQSVVDLYQEKKNPAGETSEELNEARRQGIIDSGFVITEVDDFSKMYEGLFDPKPSNTLEKLTNKGKKIPKSFREWTTYRENLIRLAAWRYFKKKIADNPDQKIYAASKQTEIDQITDPEQKAAKLARELIGDYGNISHAGQAIRTHLMPFYSWLEINAPRYIRLMRNAKAEGTDIKGQLAKVAAKQVAWKGTALAARMAVFSTLVSAWNHMMFPDEEEKLSEFEREQLHIILGTWDGEVKTLRFQGAFSDFLAWASLHDAPSDIADMWSGKKSVTDQIVEMAKAPALKIAAGISPIFKTPAELISGESYWPDFLNPRPIRDRFEHIANAFSLGTIYKMVAGKPTRGGYEWTKLFVTSTDPGESAYYKNWEKVRAWRDKLGKDDVGGHKPSTKANALYYYKQAMKYQDVDAARKYYMKYIELSGGLTKDGKVPKKTLKSIDRSIKRANPKSRIPAGTWNAFVKSLSKDERKTWNEGIKWYTSVYKKKKKK